jgi:magnesium-transporting ATPase (P-type)
MNDIIKKKWCEILLKSEENTEFIGSLKSSQIFVLLIFVLSTYLYFVFIVFIFSLFTNYEYVTFSKILNYGSIFVVLLMVLYSINIYISLIHKKKYKRISEEKKYSPSSKVFLIYTLLSIVCLFIIFFSSILLKL